MDNIFIDLLMAELNRTQQLKSDLESKTVGYMTSVALMLSVLTAFIIHIYENHRMDESFRVAYYACITVFCIGLLFLVLFAWASIPRRMEYFSSIALLELRDSDESDAEKRNAIIVSLGKCIRLNDKTVKKVCLYGSLFCKGLVALTLCFICAVILFFYAHKEVL